VGFGGDVCVCVCGLSHVEVDADEQDASHEWVNDKRVFVRLQYEIAPRVQAFDQPPESSPVTGFVVCCSSF
jgi:hypothetical protein